ncbi:DUF721 domain-containing protein [Humitalea sp. 24SJ18S-53]|uniref:DUF721 domain-containing protein n=1 Tax=Humitalea sp. 24SJ18S-53 TaxID=3422307 RepID=UPI003D66A210
MAIIPGKKRGGGGVKRGHAKGDAPQAPPPSSATPPKPPWRAFDLRALGALIPTVARPALRRHGGQAALLIADWAEIAGPALAELGVPKSLSAGTLTLACTGPAAMQLQMMAPVVMDRVNTHLGRAVVQRLRFVQSAPRPVLPRAGAAQARPDAPLPPHVLADLSGIESPDLRAALEKMARGVYRNTRRG